MVMLKSGLGGDDFSGEGVMLALGRDLVMVDMLSIGDRLRVWRGAVVRRGGLRRAISGGSGVIFPVSGRGGVIV